MEYKQRFLGSETDKVVNFSGKAIHRHQRVGPLWCTAFCGAIVLLCPSECWAAGPGAGPAGDSRFFQFAETLLILIEGNAGAMVMVLAGVAAVISAAFGAYRSALSLLVVALGAFTLRSMVEIFFNYGQAADGAQRSVYDVGAPPISTRYRLNHSIY